MTERSFDSLIGGRGDPAMPIGQIKIKAVRVGRIFGIASVVIEVDMLNTDGQVVYALPEQSVTVGGVLTLVMPK